MRLFHSDPPEYEHTIKQETMLQSRIYEEGKREGREEMKREILKTWNEWMESELERRTNLLYDQEGYEMIRQGYRPDKEDVAQITAICLSPQYPFLRKVMLGYAQNSYRLAGAGKNDSVRPRFAELGNLITGFVSWMEALHMKQEV